MSSATPASSAPAIPVLGLTGAAGAGKSAAADVARQLGCAVLDVDRMGHEALDLAEVRDAVLRTFGAEYARPDGRLDRERLARVVFADDAARARLEGLVHPVVRRRVDAEIARARAAVPAPRAIVVDCALLFEGGLDVLCDATAVVEAAESTRERRVAASRGWSREELRRREAAQLPASEKRARAGRTIANDGTADELRTQVGQWIGDLASPEGTSR